MGRLTSPHQILPWLFGSSTMNLSCGERPVCLPVRTTSGPSAATTPSPARMASSYSSAVERLTERWRPSGGRVRGLGGWSARLGLVVAIGGMTPRGAGDHVTDRPAARDAGSAEGGPQESASTVALPET